MKNTTIAVVISTSIVASTVFLALGIMHNNQILSGIGAFGMVYTIHITILGILDKLDEMEPKQ